MENIAWKVLVTVAFMFVVLQGAGGDPVPPLVHAPNYIQMKENVLPGSVIGNLTAQDPGGGEVTITTGSSSVVYLRHNAPDLWFIILNKTQDRETTNRMTLSFTAEGQTKLPFNIELYVLDVNDVAPIFQNLPYNVAVEESTSPGTVVYTGINTTDPDDGLGGLVQFSMKAEMQGGESGLGEIFTIKAQNGDITLTGHLDYETNKFYHYIITAKDGGNLTRTTDLFITVTDVQDTEPYFTGLPYMISLKENTTIGSVHTVNAYDGDTGVPNNVNYSFVSADPVNCSHFFGLNNATGEITVTSNSLDRDRPPFLDKNGVCVFIVQAVEISTDPGPRLNDTANCTLTITVNDVNDNVPTFSNNRFTATITENSGPGTPLTLESGIQLSVSDADQGENSDFILGLSNSCLSITPTDVRGSANIILLVLNSSCFDYEVLETMTFRIIATYNDGNTTYADVDLQVINTNDNAPVIQEQLVFPSIPEDSSTSTTVVTIQATDADDKPPYNNITYSLQGGDDMFVIGKHTGVVTVNKNGFDYETRTSYTLIVEATDEGGLRDSATLIVNITDVNDNEPIFKRPEYQAYVTENTIGFDRGAFLKVEATDEDEKYFLSSHSSNISYSFVHTPWSSNFSINEMTGEINLTTRLDYESTGASFILTVNATDGGSPEKFGSVNVIINVQDKNDVYPHFDKNAYSGNVSENAGIGTTIISLNATDGDGSAPNNDTFYLISSGSNDQFSIDSISGSITTVGELDRETISRYVLVVLAVDRGSPARTATANVSIEVENINDYIPVFDPSTVLVSVDEEQAAGSIVSNFTAIDKDSDANLEYSIIWPGTKGLDENQLSVNTSVLQAAFSINPASGQITVNNRIDRETVEMATILIQVCDKAANGTIQTANGTVSIQIKDIDDNPPRFSVNTQINANISENSPRGTPLQFTTDITVSDIDKDAHSEFTLKLASHTDCLDVTPTNARGFATVLMRVSNPSCFDYETVQQMEIQVLATGIGGHYTSNMNVSLQIENINDNAPKFSTRVYTANVSEDLPPNTSIITVQAADDDRSEYNIISYSIQSGDEIFAINNNTGIVSLRDVTLDFDTRKSYRLTVEATDSGGLRDSATLDIFLTDVNDNAPIFLKSEYQAYITENKTEFDNGEHLVVKAHDNDEENTPNSDIHYSFATEVGSSNFNFNINETSGEILVTQALDYEITGGSIILVINASDRGSSQKFGLVNVTVTVQDTNDCSPKFEQLHYVGSVNESALRETSVLYVHANDSDGSAPNNDVFYIIASGSNDQFVIDGNSGYITTAATLDRERVANYTLTVLAIDRGSPAMTASTTVNIEVLNLNDDPPRFEPAVASVSVDEEIRPGSLVCNFSAHDGDSDAALRYSILWQNSSGLNESQSTVSEFLLRSSFKINQSTGFISVNERIDRETLDSAVLLIMVVDTNAAANTVQTATGTVSVRVNDVNDHMPVFSPNGTVTANVTENSPIGTPLQMNKDITILDVDKDTNSDFSLAISNYTSCLEVTPIKARREATVLIRVSDATCFDYESRQTLEFQIIATESTTRTSSNVSVTLTILNENDNDPTFNKASYNGSVVENKKDFLILQVHATDNDTGIFGSISYSLEGDRDRFTINNGTGEITTKDDNLDRETKDTYQLTVVATDSGGRRSGVPLSITVTDANDETPAFLYSYASRIAEGSRQFASNLTLQANDNDQQGSENSHVIYRIATCNPHVCSNFTLDENTGLLTVNSSLDYEKLLGVEGVITITVWAIDNGSPQLTGNTTVQITVEDKNDVQPVFSSQTYKVDVPENATSGTLVQQVHATDSDGSAPNNDVFYIISSGSNDQFVIDGKTGNITTVGTLDRESVSSYALIVLAIDRGSPAMTASTTVNIGVLNVNDDPPKFEPPVASVSVNEEIRPGSLVCNFSAHDGDSDAALRYSILWQNSSGLNESQSIVSEVILQSSFKIDQSTGFISVNERLDRETLESAVLLIMVVDTNAAANTVQTATGTVSVRVNDVNDHMPVFSPNGTVTANVTENSPTGTPLQMNKDITILDVDKDTNSDFDLTISNHTTCLEVTPIKARREATVLIRVSDPKCFDYEITQKLDFQIIATESTTRTSSNVSVTLTILNENDNDPTFNKSSYNGSVVENKKDLLILQVHATDNDAGIFGSISYSLEGDRDRFTINNTGEITTKDDNLDRETKDTYLLTVVATDSGGRRSGVPLAITVTDANDETPAFLYSYASRIAEGSRQFASNLTLKANDNDQQGSENSHVIYRIATCEPNICSNFTLDQNSGLLDINSSLDYEKLLGVEGVITIIVMAIDNGTPQLTSNTTVQITVEDINDVQPVFSQQTYTASVPENEPSGTLVQQVHADDSDGSAPNNDVFYIISSGSNDQFVIDGKTGNITTVGTLDRESVASYDLIVLAIDRGSPAMTANTTVHIEVTNVNDDPPRFEPPAASVSVNEEINPGSLVYNFSAHDGDSDAALNYSILLQNSSGLDESQNIVPKLLLQSSFKINQSTGFISVNERLDRETLESAVLLIMVVDTKAAANTVQTATGTLSVRINDINDHVPVFSPNGTVTANVTENSPTGTPLQIDKDITILDVDKDTNSDFNLSISNYTNCLEVTPPKARREATVLIRVSDPKCFDYESIRTIQFQIVAAMTSSVTVTLNILDENDNDPTFNQTSYNGSVVENWKDFLILQVHAIDNDTGIFGSISYTLEGDRERFTINSSTGEIRSKDETLDRETKDTYLLTVVATDGGGRRSGMPLTITVTDANDENPAFTYSYASRIAEGSPDFPSPVTLQAKDNDQKDSVNSHVIYRMTTCTPNYCSNFTLDENSGVLSVNSTLDYEKLVDVKGVITIIVQAIDKGVPQLTGNTTVNITVEDKNDVHPVFSNLIYAANVPENAQAGQSVTQVSASDGDGSAPNNVVFYVLESGGSDNFRVNSTSGLITVGPGANLDREKDANYSLIVLTVDRGDPPLSSTATVFISLVDENDEPPKFNEQTYEFSIYENASAGDVISVVTANDPDTNHNLVYSLLLNESQAFTDRDVSVDSSIFRSWFNISSSTGSIRVTSTLDRERAEMVILKIAVSDRNGSSNLPQTAKTSLRITLRDVNDNKPFITSTGVLNVSEALTIGTEVTTLTAMDPDKDQTVSFFVSNISSPFQITTDGKVFVNRSLDRETSAMLEFTVYAKDSGQPSMTSNITIHVNVIDKNDNDPQIANTDLIFNVSEGASNGTVFGVINATDKDEGPNAMLTFGFSDIVNDFSINETTGELSVKRNLDRESLDIYKIGIIALDNPTTDVSRRASKQITINILDTNDNYPKFVNFDPNTQSYLGTVAETELVNSSVTKMNPNMITATDKDVGENARLSYNIHSLGGVDYFIINPNSGVITVNASIVGLAGLYNYTLTVTDHGDVPLTVSANLTIKVVDVNLNKPIFRDNAPRIVVAECTPIGTLLYTFIADDADQDTESNGKVIYILGNSTMSPADANHFHLNEETGLLTSTATFDREIQSSFRISVTARDLGVPSSLETILSDVEIVLQDENDNPPVFNITRYTFEISESQMSGEVGTVVARDPDNDARTCYSLESSYFSISSNTSNEGVLTLMKPLDREKPEQVTFVFSVTANDCSPSSVNCKDIMSGRTSVTEVNITVLDVNDNPPNFTQPEYSRGFMTTADFGHVIYNLQELVTDPDTPPNRVHAFYPLGPLEMDPTLKEIASVQNLVDPLILTKNGTVLTNVKFPADAQGLYKWRVVANDSAGNSTTLLKIYIVDEDKLVRITLFQTEDRLRTLQTDIVREISRQTGYDIVADEIKPFIDSNGIVDPSKSHLLIHAVAPDEKIVDASSLLEKMDRINSLIQTMKNSYQVLSIQTEKVAAAAGEGDGVKIELILAAIIVVLVMAFLITLFLMLNNIRRFKRKLKSATTSAGEMSPIPSSPLDRSGIKNNPLYGKEIMNETNVDNTSIASSDSMDKNYVIRPPLENEEQEMKINIYGNEDDLPAYKNRQNYLQNVLDGADLENGDPKGFTFNDSELLHTEI